MLVFYQWSPVKADRLFQVLCRLGSGGQMPRALRHQRDWLTIQRLAVEGRRHEVSESLTRLLGAATKGSRTWLDIASVVPEAAIRGVDLPGDDRPGANHECDLGG